MYHIGFCGDEKYMKFIAAAMYSIVKNTDKSKSYKNLLPHDIVENQDQADEKYCFHIITDGISEETRAKLFSLEKELTILYPCSLEIHYADSSVFEEFPHWRGNLVTYYKVLFLKFLPADVSYALYLDGDILVLSDIRQLFAYDLGDKWIGAVPDNGVLTDMFEDKICLGRNGTQPYPYARFECYVNAGLIMFNTKLCGQKMFLEEFFRAGQLYQANFPDQDYINMVCNGNIHLFPFKWNVMFPKHISPEDFAEQCTQYDKTGTYAVQAAEGIKNPCMLHYLIKPWASDGFLVNSDAQRYFYPNMGLWWEYAQQVPHCFREELMAIKTSGAYADMLEENKRKAALFGYAPYRWLYILKTKTRPFFRALEQPFKKLRRFKKR